jgi:hypothetical protein
VWRGRDGGAEEDQLVVAEGAGWLGEARGERAGGKWRGERASGAMSSTEEQKSLEQTPTWAVATVCTVFVVASLLVERGINALGRVSDINFTRNFRACYPLLHRPWPTYI